MSHHLLPIIGAAISGAIWTLARSRYGDVTLGEVLSRRKRQERYAKEVTAPSWLNDTSWRHGEPRKPKLHATLIGHPELGEFAHQVDAISLDGKPPHSIKLLTHRPMAARYWNEGDALEPFDTDVLTFDLVYTRPLTYRWRP